MTPSRYLLLVLAVSWGWSPAQNRKTLVVPDEHPTIMAALDAAAEGDTVVVKEGLFREGLVLKSGVTIRGVLDRTIVETDGSLPALDASSVENCRIERLVFRHARPEVAPTAAGSIPVIQIRESQKLAFQNCSVTYSLGDGLHIEHSGEIQVQKCTVKDALGTGVRIAEQSGVTAVGVVASFCGVDGIAVVAGSSLKGAEMTTEGNRNAGVAMAGLDSAVSLRELVARANDRGVQGMEAGTFELEGGKIQASEKEGVLMSEGVSFIAKGTLIEGHKKSGVWITKGAKGKLTDVTCQDNGDTGCSAVHAGTRLEVEKGHFKSNKSYGIHVQQGAHGRIVGCESRSNVGSGFSAADEGTEVEVLNGVFSDNERHGLTVTNKATAKFVSNVVEDNKQQGMGVFELAVGTLEGNKSCRNGSNGLQVWKGGRAHLIKNTFDSNNQSGVEVHSEGSAADFKGNLIRRNNQYGVLFASGAAVVELSRDNDITKNRKGKMGK